MTSFLYIIAHPEGWRKVGFSNNPVARIGSHQRHSGATLTGEAVFPCMNPRESESAAHDALSEFRVMGEWFAVDLDEAERRISSATGLTRRPFPTAPMPSIAMTPDQARAARALLKLGVRDVSDAVGVTPNTVSRVENPHENAKRGANPSTVSAMRLWYETRGVTFTESEEVGPGVALKSKEETVE